MRKYIKTILFCSIICAVLCQVSCKKYLDKSDDSVISEKEAFKNFVNFQGYTEELYNCIVNFSNNYWTNSFNWGEDEITSTAGNFHFIHKIDDGNFWGWQSQFDGWGAGWMDQPDFTTGTRNDRAYRDLWNASWYGLRKVSIGLANMDKMTEGTTEERNLIKGQLLFFRGWFHFQLMQYFGGLPYIDHVIPGDQPVRLARLKYQQCADKAAADFRAAADVLPVNWDNTTAGKRTLGKNQLRINKIMALGYLGKNYLWAGSPLMNLESTGSKSYNAEYCKKAAAAFSELLKLTESGEAQYSLVDFANYQTNFYTTGQNWSLPGSTEAIFRGPYISANSSNWGLSKQYTPLVIGDGDLKFVPTANYVNYYGMANGLPISDATKADVESGYDPEYPWKGRDPRFYNNIVFDGVKCIQGSTTDEPNRYANLFTGGTYRNVSTGSRTGYVLRKFTPMTVNKYDNGFDYGNSLHIYVPYMRLADVYLMYAEAAMTGYGSPTGKDPNFSKTAIDAINVIRSRAGVSNVAGKFLGALESALGELRRERAVELAFEGHRFNDLRRWHLLIERPYTLKTSLEFNRVGTFNTTDPKLNKVANLREQIILERKFSEKHYWLPLKNADVNMYVEFPQNPGW